MSAFASASGPGPFSRSFNRTPHSTAMGVLLLVLGILAIILPLVAGIAVAAIVGWVLLLGGIAHLVYAWSARGSGAVLWQVLLGIIYVLVGLYFIFHPASGLVTLTLLLAIYFVIEGILELIAWFRVRGVHHAGWTLWNGIITLILGLLIWAHWPFSSVWALGTLVGISLILSGIARLSFRSRPVLSANTGVL